MQSIFVSSTFADMQRERDSLRDIVSPAINSMARKYNDHVEFCDLRWGINTEDLDVASASRKVLDVCLDEVDRSNPPMVILLGDRYDWIPDSESVRSIAAHKQFLLNDYRKSVMAIEAEFGAIFRKKKTLVYIRSISNNNLSSGRKVNQKRCFFQGMLWCVNHFSLLMCQMKENPGHFI